MREQLVKSTKQVYDGVNSCTTITVHETDNTSLGADAAAHANLQASGNVRQASWHIQVDDVEAIRSYPDEAQCWHAGTREGCETSIAVEICVNADGAYDKAFTRAASTVAELRQKHGLPRSAIVQHSHWTGKNCPRQMRLAGRWDEFTQLTDPKENIMANTPAQAIAKSLTITKGYAGLCLVFVRTCFGVAAKYPTASAGWANAEKKHKTSSTAGIPEGVPIWFYVPGLPAGHVALYLGGGKCRMNISHKGTVETVTVDWYLNFSKGTLLGWTEDINGVDVYGASALKPAGNVKPSKPSASKPSAGKVVRKQTNSTRPNGSTTFPTDYEDLKLDKDFGAFTIGALQILLHALKRRHNKQWDGIFGKRGVMDFQEQLQAMGYYKTTPFAAKGVRKGAKLKVDGGDGYWFWVAVQMMLRDRKHYNRAIDGNPKGYTIEGLQAWLNTQNGN